MCGKSEECSVHGRNDMDQEDEFMGEKFITLITYHDEWCIVTSENPYMVAVALLKKQMLPFATMLVKVGQEGVLGDFTESGDELPSYDGYFSETVEGARTTHEMVLYGVQSGLMNPDKLITVGDILDRY